MEIPKELLADITQYCNANNITDVDAEILSFIKVGFSYKKYSIKVPVVKTEKKETKEIIENKDLYNED